jgi:hypothetical protein
MERDESLLSIRALKEAVVSSSIASIRTLEDTAIRLFPCRRLCWVSFPVPLKCCDAIIRGPAIVGRVGDIGLSAKIESVWSLLHRGAALFPGLIRLGDDAQGPDGHEVGSKLTDACRLVLNPGHARVHKVVAELVRPEDCTVNTPVVRELGSIGPTVPRCGTT